MRVILSEGGGGTKTNGAKSVPTIDGVRPSLFAQPSICAQPGRERRYVITSVELVEAATWRALSRVCERCRALPPASISALKMGIELTRAANSTGVYPGYLPIPVPASAPVRMGGVWVTCKAE